MPFYKDLQNKVHVLDAEEYEYLLPLGCVRITPEEAEALQPKLPASSFLEATPWQIRKALNQTGLRAAVEAAVAAADQETKDGWEFAQEFRRDNPLIASLSAAIGKSDAEIDALFELAVTL